MPVPAATVTDDALYAALSTVIDPEIDVVRVYHRQGDLFTRPVELSREAGDLLHSTLLPGLEIPLARVFRDT